MFGRVRAASTSLDCLERPPSKLLKDDPLSIYEATLEKLKLGSKHDLSPNSANTVEKEADSDTTSVSEVSRYHSSFHLMGAVKKKADCVSVNNSVESTPITVAPHDNEMEIDADCSSACISPTFSCSKSICSSKQQKKQNGSVLYLFSKFSSQNAPKLSNDEAMVTENDYSSANKLSSSVCVSFSSSNTPEAISEEERSLPVC